MQFLQNVANALGGISGEVKDFNYVWESITKNNIPHNIIIDQLSDEADKKAIQITLSDRIVLLSPNKRDNENLRINLSIHKLQTSGSVIISSNPILSSVLDITQENIDNIIGYVQGNKVISLSFENK